MQTIWGDPDRMTNVYFQRYCKDKNSKDWHDWPYFAGDGAVYAADGYFRILGRIDDVINVAGHRLGTKELESAALTVPEVAEAAVVPVLDELKGRVPELYVSLKPGFTASRALSAKIAKALSDHIGPIAKPKNVWIVPDMPKTRSGKIMRRILAAISARGATGDITTLANPEMVEIIRNTVQKEEWPSS
jgi:acetyl-CoA synthetase